METINDPIVLEVEQVPGATIETVVVPGEATIAPEIPVAPVLEEKRYEYQPTDADGRPMGGKQVILYRTSEELAEKLSRQNTEILRKLREVTRKRALGIDDEGEVSPETRYTGPQEFKPRVLTPDERMQLAQDILDPEHFDRAVTTVFEASVGTTAKGLSETLTKLEADNQRIKALREADIFMATTPEYVRCEENGKALAQWVARKGYAPTAENYKKAYDTLLAQDVLVTSLEVVPQSEYVPPVEPIAPVTPVEPTDPVDPPAREDIPVENQGTVVETPPTRTVSRVATGLSRSNSSDVGTPAPIGSDIVYEYVQRDSQGRQVGTPRVFKGQAAVDAMPSEEYKRRLLHEPGFKAKLDKLERDLQARRNRS